VIFGILRAARKKKLLFSPEDGYSMILRNLSISLRVYTPSQQHNNGKTSFIHILYIHRASIM
jgi:hypothetical protein